MEKAGRRSVTILDPATGRRTVSLEELGRHFTGVALELSPTANFVPVEARVRTKLSDLWSRLVNYRGATVQILILSLLLQCHALVGPSSCSCRRRGDRPGDANLLLLLLVGFGLVHALNGVIRALRSWVVLTLGQSLSYQLGGNVVRHLLRLPLGFFERRHVGDLLSRVGSIQPIQSILSQGLVNVVIDSALAVTTLIVMTLISPLLMLIVVGTTLAYLAYGLLLFPGLRRRTEEEIVARANEETFLMESLRAMRSIKLHTHEAMRENGGARLAEGISSATGPDLASSSTSAELLFSAQLLLVVYFGATACSASADRRPSCRLPLLRSSFTSSATALGRARCEWRLSDPFDDCPTSSARSAKSYGCCEADCDGSARIRLDALSSPRPYRGAESRQVSLDISGGFVAISARLAGKRR